jgi:hypothetical protein
MFNTIELAAPSSTTLRMLFGGFKRIHAGLYGQMCVRELFRSSHVLTQMAGHNYMSLKLLLPLVATEAQLDRAVGALGALLHAVRHEKVRFWSQGMAIGTSLAGLA